MGLPETGAQKGLGYRKRPRVLIADDHRILLEGLGQLLTPVYTLAGLIQYRLRTHIIAAQPAPPESIRTFNSAAT